MNAPPPPLEPQLPHPIAVGGDAEVVIPDSPRLDPNSTLSHILSRGKVRGSAAILGPAFVASVAYVDPGNFATNFAAGAKFGYQLVWVILMANFMAILV